MTKYLLKRLLHGAFSIVIMTTIVMILVYSLMNRDLIFAADPMFTKQQYNKAEVYKHTKWESYGYEDYVPYSDYLTELLLKGEINEETRAEASKVGRTPMNDNSTAASYIKSFTDLYKSKGYTVVRLDYVAKVKQKAEVFAYKDIPVLVRVWHYFTGLIRIDNVHYVERTYGVKLENTGIRFTFFDPAYNTLEDGTVVKKVFSPAVMGRGTENKYLLYFDDQFPFIHQNLISIHLGESYSVSRGVDIFDTLFNRQDPNKNLTVTFPSGLTEESPRNIHTATYVPDSQGLLINPDRFLDDYTGVSYFKNNFSKTGFSFIIGIISVILSYLVGVPLGIIMSRNKDKIVDKLGTIYIIFIIAVPSLAYIFMFKAIGKGFGLPISFNLEPSNKLEYYTMFILPIISLALPSVAGLMKWLRRYMIDQMNSDYVKFARSGGLTEKEIFTKHILKNAAIPIIHGVPGAILGSITGAIITERVYRVPGAGYLLTDAINKYDNGVIVGLTMFYAILKVVSIILGDLLMSMVDPRISFTNKGR
ncbi:MAG: ABC transporter permease [Clostridia bacterium]|nr:ABC transporter permease [Clostridia bacterium]